MRRGAFIRSPNGKLARNAYRATLDLQRTADRLIVNLEQSFDVAANIASKFSYLSKTATDIADSMGSRIADIDSIVAGLSHAKLVLRLVPVVGGVVSKVIGIASKTVVRPMKKAFKVLETKLENGASTIEKVQDASSKLVGLMSNTAMFGLMFAQLVSVIDVLTSAYRCVFEAQDAQLIEEIESVLTFITDSARNIKEILNIGNALASLKSIETAVVNPIIASFKSFVNVLNGLSAVMKDLAFLAEIANSKVEIPGVPPLFNGFSLKLVDLLAPLQALSFVLWIFEKPLELIIYAIMPKFSLPFLPQLSNDFFTEIESVAKTMVEMFDAAIERLRNAFGEIENMVGNVMAKLPQGALPCSLDFEDALSRRLQTTQKRKGDLVTFTTVAKKFELGFCKSVQPRKKRKLNMRQQKLAVDAHRGVRPDKAHLLVQAVQLQPQQQGVFDYGFPEYPPDVFVRFTVCAKVVRDNLPSPRPTSTPTREVVENFLVISYKLTDQDNVDTYGPECWFEVDKDGQIEGGDSVGDGFDVEMKLNGNPWNATKGEPDEDEDGTFVLNYKTNWKTKLQ